jgi:hypothetical protein
MTRVEGPLKIMNSEEYNKIVWNPDKADSFQHSLDFLLKYHDDSIDNYMFTNCILSAAKDNGMLKIRKLATYLNPYGPRWFDKTYL